MHYMLIFDITIALYFLKQRKIFPVLMAFSVLRAVTLNFHLQITTHYIFGHPGFKVNHLTTKL